MSQVGIGEAFAVGEMDGCEVEEKGRFCQWRAVESCDVFAKALHAGVDVADVVDEGLGGDQHVSRVEGDWVAIAAEASRRLMAARTKTMLATQR